MVAVGILGLDLFVAGLGWMSLLNSRRQYVAKAAITAQNLSQVLEQNIAGTISKVAVGVGAAAREAERQLANGGLDGPRLVTYLGSIQGTLPELDGLRVADERGNLIYGPTWPMPAVVNVADRDYFLQLKNTPQSGLLVSKPIKGRVAGHWIIIIGQRISKPNGAFAGVAFGALPLERIDRLFSTLQVGAQGAFALRDGSDLSLVVRHPEPQGLGSAVGHKTMSQEFLEQIKTGAIVGTYDAPSGLDRKMRTWAFRKFDNGLFYIFVGLAKDEYLLEWRREVHIVWTFLAFFLLLSLLGGFALQNSWKRSRKAEEAIRANDARIRLFFERQIVGMAVSSADRRWIEVNDKWCQIIGYCRKELEQLTWDEITHPDDLSKNLDLFHRLVDGSIDDYTLTKRFLRKDGSIALVELSVGCARNADGSLNCLLSLMEDVTPKQRAEEERLQLERQLQNAQKLESLGVLAGGIAHDFNNILMAIIGNADLALMRINRESPASENLARIVSAAAQAADLAKQMLAYSGKGKFILENLDLNVLLQDMLHMLEVSISKKAVLRLNLAENLPLISGDATQMRQIIMNLVINASEAIGNRSGVIAITTGCMDCDKNYLNNVWLNQNLTDGLYVYLEVADTGCGMDKLTLAKIFDPFFTTKFTGRGLGMAVVLGIIRGHKGAIKVYSEVNKGTSFKVLLPASAHPAELFNESGHADGWTGTGTVLLVDDEETVRSIGSEMLRELGFKTVTAEDGREALEVFQRTPNIALVILDLTMPHLDGEQCFRELRRLRPEVRVIMSSGYNEQEVTLKFMGKELAGFIQKPYRLSTLKEAVRKALGSTPS